jgi:4-pyridoxate dehydrogenase
VSAAREFDYIIVGAGSAGSVLAARLSEDRETRVLVVEAGGWDSDPYIRIPLAWGRLFARRSHDWGYDTQPEPHLNGRTLDCARGKVVGGSSSTNAMAYARGHPADYDRWAEAGLEDWSFDRVLPYFKKAESWEEGESQYRGGSGPLTTARGGLDDPMVDAWFRAAERQGHPRTDDTCGEQMEGFAVPQWTIRKGRRCSAAVAYLHPARRRPNVTLLTHALTRRILFEGKRAVGIEYEKGGGTNVARARREVILSAGAINSPQLLIASGIGAHDELKEIGVEPVIDLPGVGKNLHDHMSVGMEYRRKGQGVFQKNLRYDRFVAMVARGLIFGTGLSAGLPMGCVAFLRSRFANGPSPDLVLLFRASGPVPMQYLPFADPGPGRGRLSRRADAAGKPGLASSGFGRHKCGAAKFIRTFLSAERDLHVMREGLRMVRALNADEEVSSHVEAELAPGPDVQDDVALDEYVRNHATTVHHPVGSCKMSTDDDPLGVVDGQLRVRGVEALRVIDASVMPSIVSGPTNGPTIMLAEKGADIVRRRRAAEGG